MKKYFYALLLVMSIPANAAGPYDGIWEIDPLGYAIVSEIDTKMLVVTVFNEEYGGIWNASEGFRIDNKARIRQIVGLGYSVLDLEIKSDTSADITQVSCISPITDQECPFANGHKFIATKIW